MHTYRIPVKIPNLGVEQLFHTSIGSEYTSHDLSIKPAYLATCCDQYVAINRAHTFKKLISPIVVIRESICIGE